MKVSDILRKIADAVDADAEQQAKNQDAQAALHAQDIEQAKADAAELQAGQVAQVVQAANNIKRAAEKDADAVAMSASQQAPTPNTYEPTPADDQQEPNTHELTPADNTDDTEIEVMVTPLQQKHELLKKATDTANDVDKFDDDMSDHRDNELDLLKKMAGIKDSQPAPDDLSDTALIQLSSDEFDT